MIERPTPPRCQAITPSRGHDSPAEQCRLNATTAEGYCKLHSSQREKREQRLEQLALALYRDYANHLGASSVPDRPEQVPEPERTIFLSLARTSWEFLK